MVKGVITNDVVGRPTEIRFFYKQHENENFVVYFPNFNLTTRDPGNYGELAMITLPQSVQARFVILGEYIGFPKDVVKSNELRFLKIGIVNYLENPCLKFELLGCEDDGEEAAQLGWDLGYPVCVGKCWI